MTQLRLWFKNHRYHDRQKRENEELTEQNKWLAAGNILWSRKNADLQAQFDQLNFDNELQQNELMDFEVAAADLGLNHESASEGTTTSSDDNNSLPSLAEETEDEFLSESVGTIINFNPIPRPLQVPDYVEHLANKSDVKMGLICSSQPIYLRSFSKRLSRGFNDVVNVLTEDGWNWMSNDASNDVVMSIEQTYRFGASATNNFPASLTRLLKECFSAWMNVDFANDSIAFSGAARHAFPEFDIHNIFEKALTFNRTELEDEVGDIFFMQITNGTEDSGFGACSELIFGLIDKNAPSHALLLCSGFGIYLLSLDTTERQWIQSLANILTSNEAFTSDSDVQSSIGTTSRLILAFQFPSGAHFQQHVATMAWKYVQRVTSSVKILSLDELPSESYSGKMICAEENPATFFKAAPESNHAVDLATLITKSFRSILGLEMLDLTCPTTASVSRLIQNHQDLLFCLLEPIFLKRITVLRTVKLWCGKYVGSMVPFIALLAAALFIFFKYAFSSLNLVQF